MRTCLAVALILTIWIGGRGAAHAAASPIQITPPTPSFTDPIFITVSGRASTNCTPRLHNVSLNAPSIRIDGRVPVPPDGCTPTPTDWSFTARLEPLDPNFYVIEVYIDDGAGPKPYAQTKMTVLGGITVQPRMPTKDETIQLTAAFLNGDACIPQYDSHRIETHLIIVETLQPNAPCAQVPTPWSVDVDLGQLLVGRYTVEVYTTVADTNPPQRRLVGDGTFLVVAQRLEYYFPFLPLSGIGGGATLGP